MSIARTSDIGRGAGVRRSEGIPGGGVKLVDKWVGVRRRRGLVSLLADDVELIVTGHLETDAAAVGTALALRANERVVSAEIAESFIALVSVDVACRRRGHSSSLAQGVVIAFANAPVWYAIWSNQP